jgi:hypothetical protein
MNRAFTVYSPLARKVYPFHNEKEARAFYDDFIGDAVLFEEAVQIEEKRHIKTFEQMIHSALYILHGISKYPDKETIDVYTELLPLFKHPKKGVLLIGGKGVGKTTIMKVFNMASKAKFIGGVHPFEIVEALSIKNAFLNTGYEGINDLEISTRFGRHICLDKVAPEYAVAKLYGNTTNILGEVVEDRYNAYLSGIKTHLTTILLPTELKDLAKKETYDLIYEMFSVHSIVGKNKRIEPNDR